VIMILIPISADRGGKSLIFESYSSHFKVQTFIVDFLTSSEVRTKFEPPYRTKKSPCRSPYMKSPSQHLKRMYPNIPKYASLHSPPTPRRSGPHTPGSLHLLLISGSPESTPVVEKSSSPSTKTNGSAPSMCYIPRCYSAAPNLLHIHLKYQRQRKRGILMC